MPSATATRHVVAGVAATLAVLAMVAAAVVWRTSGAGAAAAQAAGSGGGAAPATAPSPPPTEPRATTTTTTPPPPTSTTTPTTRPPVTTPTTAKPKPVPTTAPKPPPAPPTTAAAVATYAPALSSGTSPAERCAAARQWVAQHGLALPAGWGFRCPGHAIVGGTARWGMACWNCEGDGSSWIAVDIGRIGASDAALRYVIAHEICHAIDYVGTGESSEGGADVCAALHGAGRP